jgi:threonine/homoserine/homoserine lactone efflux protein
MLDLPLLLAFLVAISILTITPGLDTAMVLRAAATEDSKSAGMVAIGIALGCLLWAVAVSFGLGALLQASEFAYSIVKWAGAAYLVWLGASLLLAPRSTVIANPDMSNWSIRSERRRFYFSARSNPRAAGTSLVWSSHYGYGAPLKCTENAKDREVARPPYWFNFYWLWT